MFSKLAHTLGGQDINVGDPLKGLFDLFGSVLHGLTVSGAAADGHQGDYL